MSTLRVVIADDERPARSLLAAQLRNFADAELVGEAADGRSAVELIERVKPDLALLDLQMPEVSGLGVVRLVRREVLPLIAFVTAFDTFAVQAFEANAIDYLLKPVEPGRLRATLDRAHERLDAADFRTDTWHRVARASATIEIGEGAGDWLRRVPVRRDEDVLLVPIEQVAYFEADGESVRVTTVANERFVLGYRLKELEARLDPARFIRLSRAAIAQTGLIRQISPASGGTSEVTLTTGHRLAVSRIRSRELREALIRL